MKKEKDKKVLLYICPDCNVLLLRLDKKYNRYDNGVMAENGEYVSEDEGEDSLDYYLCPMCSTNSEEEKGLKEIVIPTATCRPLRELWYTLKEAHAIGSNDSETYRYGIPTDNKELKELLFEYLV